MLTTDMFRKGIEQQVIFNYESVVEAIEKNEDLDEIQKEIELLKAEIDRWMLYTQQNVKYFEIQREVQKHEGRFYYNLLVNAAKHYNNKTLCKSVLPLTSFLNILNDDVFAELVARLGRPSNTTFLIIAGFIFLPKFVRNQPTFKKGKFYELIIDIPADKIFIMDQEVSTAEKTMLSGGFGE